MQDRFEKFSMSIFNISRCWNKIAAEEMKKRGLKASFALYLTTLLNSEESLTATKLCDICGKDKADVSRSVATMMEKGLVEKLGDNGYRAEIVLTAKGREIAEEINERANYAVELAGSGVSEEDRAIFYSTLEVIAKNIKLLSKRGIPEK